MESLPYIFRSLNCGPSRMSAPVIKDICERYPALTLIGTNYRDTALEEACEYVAEEEINYKVVMGTAESMGGF